MIWLLIEYFVLHCSFHPPFKLGQLLLFHHSRLNAFRHFLVKFRVKIIETSHSDSRSQPKLQIKFVLKLMTFKKFWLLNPIYIDPTKRFRFFFDVRVKWGHDWSDHLIRVRLKCTKACTRWYLTKVKASARTV